MAALIADPIIFADRVNILEDDDVLIVLHQSDLAAVRQGKASFCQAVAFVHWERSRNRRQDSPGESSDAPW